jgi:hypothetical protein
MFLCLFLRNKYPNRQKTKQNSTKRESTILKKNKIQTLEQLLFSLIPLYRGREEKAARKPRKATSWEEMRKFARKASPWEGMSPSPPYPPPPSPPRLLPAPPCPPPSPPHPPPPMPLCPPQRGEVGCKGCNRNVWLQCSGDRRGGSRWLSLVRETGAPHSPQNFKRQFHRGE